MMTQRYYPHIGGAERQLGSIIPLLAAHGIEVHVITRKFPSLKSFEKVAGVPVHRLLSIGPKPIAALSFIVNAILLIRRLAPDLIHAHGLLSPLSTALIAKHLFEIPIIAKVLRGGVVGDIDRIRSKPFAAMRIAWLKNNTDLFLTISQEIDDELKLIGVPNEKRFTVPNGVEIDKFVTVSLPERKILRDSLGLPNTQIAIFAGRLVKEKNVHQIIHIWPNVRSQFPEAMLVILGTGEEENSLKKLAGPGILFNGYTEDVLPFLQAANIFLLPSSTEGLSNAMLEAMSVGLPVVISRIGGAPDVITHKHNGWLMPRAEPDYLREAIIELFLDENFQSQLGKNARKTIVSEYALTEIADRIVSAYHRVL